MTEPTFKRTKLSENVEHVDDGDPRIFVRIPLVEFLLVLLAVFVLGRCSP